MRTFMRRSSEDRPEVDAIRERRVEVARCNSNWTELAETGLVPRGRWLVEAETDELYKLYRGVVFQTGSAHVVFNDQIPMRFYVDRDGDVVFVERNGRTWSDVVATRARRAQARR